MYIQIFSRITKQSCFCLSCGYFQTRPVTGHFNPATLKALLGVKNESGRTEVLPGLKVSFFLQEA